MVNANRLKKQETVEQIKEMIAPASAVVVMHYQGLTVEEITTLRKKAYAAGAGFKVTKNSLAKHAIKDTKFSHLADHLSGPTAISFSKDPVAAAKVVVQFSKDNEKLVILGGAYEDKKLNVSEVESLANMPSLDELRAKIIAMIKTPATRIAGIVQAPAGQIARVVGAKAAKG